MQKWMPFIGRSSYVRWQALALVAGVINFAPAAQAADLGGYGSEERVGQGWTVTVGALPGLTPEYSGASQYRFNLLPSFSVQRADERPAMLFPDDGLQYALIKTANFRFGPTGNLKSGRSGSDNSELVGLDNYDWAVQAGAFGEFWFVPEVIRTRVELLWGFHSGDGLTVNLAADWVQHFGKATLAVGPRMVIMGDNTAQLEYGVTAEQAIANKRVNAYNASGGVESIGVAATLAYPLTRQVNFMAYGRYDGLMNSAADSTVTQRFGSDSQYNLGVGLTYSFNYR
jgi:outer membrane scaffolding protein for murein synthesis (MipA/OmpV family)